MLPLHRLEHAVWPDQFGLLLALDRAFEQNKRFYGPAIIEPALAELNAMQLPPIIGRDDYFAGIANILGRYGIDPWRGQSIAVVGFTRADDDASMLHVDGIDKLLRGARVVDLSKERTGGIFLNQYNAKALSGSERFDFVITGNVLNTMDNLRGGIEWEKLSPQSTMHACAQLLKKGGFAIHLLSYGDATNCTAALEDAATLRLIGQEPFFNYVDGDTLSQNAAPMAATFTQEREIDAPPMPEIDTVRSQLRAFNRNFLDRS